MEVENGQLEIEEILWDIHYNYSAHDGIGVSTELFRDYYFGLLCYKFLCEKLNCFVNNLKLTDVSYEDQTDDLSSYEEDLEFVCQNELGYFITPSRLFSNIVEPIFYDENGNSLEDWDLVYSNAKNTFKVFEEAIVKFYEGTAASDKSTAFEDVFVNLNFSKLSLKNEQAVINSDFVARIIVCLAASNFPRYDSLTPSFFSTAALYKFSSNISSSMEEKEPIVNLFTQLVLAYNNSPKSIYNPVCNSGMLLSELSKLIETSPVYYGQETSNELVAISKQNLLLNNVSPNNINILSGDALINPMHFGDKFDIIISTPPQADKWEGPNKSEFDKERFTSEVKGFNKNNFDFAYVFHCLYHLEEDGVAILVVSNRILALPQGIKMRQYLLNNNLVDAVINLDGSSKNSIASCVIILKKNRKSSENVLFIDVEGISKSKKTKELISPEQIHSVLSIIKNRAIEKEISNLISVEHLVENNCILNPKSYVLPFDYNQGISLKEILEKYVPSGHPSFSREGEITDIMEPEFFWGNLINKKDLSPDWFDYEIYAKDFIPGNDYSKEMNLGRDLTSGVSQRGFEFKKNKKTFLVNSNPLKLNPTYVTVGNESLGFDHWINAFYLKENKSEIIHLDYLVYQLHSDFIKKQMIAFVDTAPKQNKGRNIINRLADRISTTDFLNLRIALLPIQEQIEMVKAAKKTILIKNAKKLGLEEEFSKGEDDALKVKKISNEIISSFDILRGHMEVDGFPIMLIFLFLKKENILDDFLQKSDNIKSIIEEKIKAFEKSELSPVYDFFQEYLMYFEQLHDDIIFKIISRIHLLDRVSFKKNFSQIFEMTLQYCLDILGKKRDFFTTPKEVVDIMMSFLPSQNNIRLYNPFAGIASFALNLPEGATYYGQEIQDKTFVLGELRLLAHDVYQKYTLKKEDSIVNWMTLTDENLFDFLVSFPPFNTKLNGDSLSAIEYRTVESFVIHQAISSLSEKGKVVIAVANGFLFSDNSIQKELREEIIKLDLLDLVIAMPEGLLPNTSIPFSIIVLSKFKENKELVRFVDATKCVVEINKREKKLDPKKVIDLITLGEENAFYLSVKTDRIKEFEYNLSSARYFAKEFKGELISRYCQVLENNNVQNNITGIYIRIADLKNDIADCKLDISSINFSEISSRAREITQSCILVSLLGNSLKPTIFDYKGVPIFISNDILALDVDENEMFKEYLVNELLSSQVKEQIRIFSVGTVMPRLRRKDFFSLIIKYLPLEEQKAKVKGIFELSDKIKKLEEERNALAHGKDVDYFNEYASLKHSLGAPRQNILSNAKSLISFFSKNSSLAFQEVKKNYNNKYGIDLLEALQQIRQDINQISVILEKGDKGLVLNRYPKELIPLKEYIAILESLNDQNYNFTINLFPMSLDENSDEDVDFLVDYGIIGNLTLFKILVENILTNANKHAFQEKSPSNQVNFNFRLNEANGFSLIIENNGTPFPDKYTKENFITKFNTTNEQTGTGLGGYDINRIAEYLGAHNWELELSENKTFNVTFIFTFSIKPLK